jgi:hypothetical protein
MADQPADIPEKLADFHRDPNYERRVVAFYDVLGWRSKIREAATDPKSIGELRRVILLHSRTVRLPVEVTINVSTFSDNIVISTPPGPSVPYLLRELSLMQLATASRGFLLRGGVAIGDIVHDDEVVFGPALIRAYELESETAHFPRIVVDEDVIATCGPFEGFHAFEDGVYFLDPFKVDVIKFWQSMHEKEPKPLLREAGLPSPTFDFDAVPADYLLRSVLEKLKLQIRAPLADKEWVKIAWLFDRIAHRLGVPLAESYPRARPA